MRELRIALTFDVDNDFCQNPREADGLAWTGLHLGTAKILDALSELSDELQTSIPSTWFLRIDDQIAAECGHALWCLEEFSSRYIDSGTYPAIDLQWHAHLYQKRSGTWELEHEPSGQVDQLNRNYQFIRESGVAMSVSRIGESLGTDAISRALIALGIRADASAMPGRAIDGRFDWRNVSFTPYKMPSGLWQLPFSMLPVLAPYDEVPLSRYLNLGFLHSCMKAPLADLVTNRDVLIAIAHPFEVLPAAQHPLWGGTVANTMANLRVLISRASALGRPIRFITMEELAREPIVPAPQTAAATPGTANAR